MKHTCMYNQQLTANIVSNLIVCIESKGKKKVLAPSCSVITNKQHLIVGVMLYLHREKKN